jgi:hypothetical protein
MQTICQCKTRPGDRHNLQASKITIAYLSSFEAGQFASGFSSKLTNSYE